MVNHIMMFFKMKLFSACLMLWICVGNTIVTATSFSCNFDDNSDAFCGMRQLGSKHDKFDWTRKRGPTTSAGTGPAKDHSGIGNYIYIEASNPRKNGETAVIETPLFDDGGPHCLVFWYHMKGQHIGTLRVVSVSVNTDLQVPEMDPLIADQGDVWVRKEIELSSTAKVVQFSASRGEEYQGDIAIDDISVTEGTCSSSKDSQTDPCASSPCHGEATCVKHGHVFRCACPRFWVGDICDTFDPCNSFPERPCKNGGTCVPTQDNFTCICQNLYTGRYCDQGGPPTTHAAGRTTLPSDRSPPPTTTPSTTAATTTTTQSTTRRPTTLPTRSTTLPTRPTTQDSSSTTVPTRPTKQPSTTVPTSSTTMPNRSPTTTMPHRTTMPTRNSTTVPTRSSTTQANTDSTTTSPSSTTTDGASSTTVTMTPSTGNPTTPGQTGGGWTPPPPPSDQCGSGGQSQYQDPFFMLQSMMQYTLAMQYMQYSMVKMDGSTDCPDPGHPPRSEFNCTFDNSSAPFCGMTQGDTDYMDWLRGDGTTLTAGTGPYGDHTTGNGSYAYIDASNGMQSDMAELILPPFQVPGNHCLKFHYHMEGQHIGHMAVHRSMASPPVWIKTGDQGSMWNKASIDLDYSTSQVSIVGMVGDGYKGDIAIDDIIVLIGQCSQNNTGGPMPPPGPPDGGFGDIHINPLLTKFNFFMPNESRDFIMDDMWRDPNDPWGHDNGWDNSWGDNMFADMPDSPPDAQDKINHTRMREFCCKNPEPYVEVRLEVGNATAGRLEVNINGTWGTVCQDGFDMEAAHLACKALGHSGAATYIVDAYYGPASDSVPIWDISCQSDERHLASCAFYDIGIHTCSHDRDVSISCKPDRRKVPMQLAGGLSAFEGRVEILYSNQWGTVCSDKFGAAEATAVCENMGFAGAKDILYSEDVGEGTGPIWLDNLICPNDVNSLKECLHNEFGLHDCTHKEDVGVRCYTDQELWQEMCPQYLSQHSCSSSRQDGDHGNQGDHMWGPQGDMDNNQWMAMVYKLLQNIPQMPPLNPPQNCNNGGQT